MRTVKTIATIVLALLGMMMFSEAEHLSDLWVNLVGLACAVLAVAINIDKDTLDKIQGQ